MTRCMVRWETDSDQAGVEDPVDAKGGSTTLLSRTYHDDHDLEDKTTFGHRDVMWLIQKPAKHFVGLQNK